MHLADGWYTSSAQVVWGVKRHMTYALVPAHALPALPAAELDGAFAWLPGLSSMRSPLHYEDALGGSAKGYSNVDRLQREAQRRGLALPEPFVRFMKTAAIHARVPSNTDCCLDPSARLLDGLLDAGGPILRFLIDSQGAVVWYLQLLADGSSRVLATCDTDHDGDERVPEPGGQIHVVAPGFEPFIHRYWLENNVWFKVIKKEALSPEEQAYVTAAKRFRKLVT